MGDMINMGQYKVKSRREGKIRHIYILKMRSLECSSWSDMSNVPNIVADLEICVHFEINLSSLHSGTTSELISGSEIDSKAQGILECRVSVTDLIYDQTMSWC